METSLVEEVLSDGSIAYNIVFVDGSAKVTIAANDHEAAHRIQDCLGADASWATVDDPTERVKVLEIALRTMLVATDPGAPEASPGHSRSYLEQVARPRAIEALKVPTQRVFLLEE